MSGSKTMSLAGWGRALRSDAAVLRPERAREFVGALGGALPLLARGGGRSYGDAAQNAGGTVALTGRLDRILAFDPATGVAELEPGVSFRRLLDVFLPRGWMAPVTPGTGFATMGGAVASDVHGKNHERDGSFGQHLAWVELALPDGTTRRIGPDREPALFAATVGGMGLTGLITRVALRLAPSIGTEVEVRSRRVRDLDAFLAAMEAACGAHYAVGWIDGTARGGALGRGILETGEAVAGGGAAAPHVVRRVPADFPGFALNPVSIAAFNELYYRHVPRAGSVRRVPWGKFLYPLDALADWNRIYGRRGFHQFQCVVPFATGAVALRALLEAITASRRASFLAVLKRLGPGRAGYLSFPMPGFTLALDFPDREGIAALHHTLVAIVLAHGGRVYLAKDSLLTPEEFAPMYPELGAWRAVVDAVDPDRRMQSDLARRLHLRGVR